MCLGAPTYGCIGGGVRLFVYIKKDTNPTRPKPKQIYDICLQVAHTGGGVFTSRAGGR